MKTLLKAAIASAFLAGPVFAGGHAPWESVNDKSLISFGSIKKDVVGEVHTFGETSGAVDNEGNVTISINLGSVETNIDIRNERMIKHVFKALDAKAELSGTVDMDDVNGLAVGATTETYFEGQITFAGVSSDVEADLFVARLSEDRVLVTTSNMIMLSTADLGVDEGIDKLKELASLSGITRVTPVTVRMVFEKQ